MGAVIAAPARTALALGEKEPAVEERKRALKVKMRCCELMGELGKLGAAWRCEGVGTDL